MARRDSKNQSSTTPESPKEDTVSTTTTEAPVQTEGAAPAAAEAPINLDAFKAAASAAVAEADKSTGELAPAIVEPVVKEYRNLDGLKAKNAAKKFLGDEMKAQMSAGSIQGARSYLQLQESMTAGSGGSSAPKAPADPTEAFVQSEATLRLASALHLPGEGVAEDHESRVENLVATSTEAAQAYLTWVTTEGDDKGDEPEASAVVKNAVKLALGKAAKAGGRTSSGGTFTGERRDIGKHIASAFADAKKGAFLTVAEIKNHKSDEYGDNSPSAGAISARLFPSSGKCTVEGIEPGTNEKGNKGATKL